MKAEEGLTQRQQRAAEEAERRGQASKGGSPQPGTRNPQPEQSVRRFRRGTQIGNEEEGVTADELR